MVRQAHHERTYAAILVIGAGGTPLAALLAMPTEQANRRSF